ncbi:MAG: hypothetical protein IPF68_18625 [Bacteroidales bacterium]|nr:hypothetical protein [Bacteroidales bacterium]
MKKYIPYLLMVSIAGILVLAFFPLRNYYLFLKEPVSPLTDAVPEGAALIVKTSSVEKLVRIIRASELFEMLERSKTRYGIKSIVAKLDNIRSDEFFKDLATDCEVMICMLPDKELKPEMLFLLDVGKVSPESIKNRISEVLPENSKIEKVNFKPADLYRIVLGGSELWFYVRKGILAIAYNRQIAEQSCMATNQARTLTTDTAFAKLTRISGKRVDGVLMLNNRKLVELFLQTKNDNPLVFNGSPFDGWTSLDLHIEKDRVLMDGFMAGRNEPSILNRQVPGTPDQLKYFPGTTAFAVSLLISDQEEYTTRFLREDTIQLPGYDSANNTLSTEVFRRNEHIRSWIGNSVSLVALPAYFTGNDSAKMVMIRIKSEDSALCLLKPFLKPYKESIKLFTATGLIQHLWGSFFDMGPTQYCLLTDQALILSPSARLLEDYIIEVEENKLLGSSKLFKEASALLTEESSLTVFLIPDLCSRFAGRHGSVQQLPETSHWTGVAESSGLLCLQISPAEPVLYTHAFLLLDPKIKQLAYQFEESNFQYPKILKSSETKVTGRNEATDNNSDIPINGSSVSNATSIVTIVGDKTNDNLIIAINKNSITAIARDGQALWTFACKGEPVGEIRRLNLKGTPRYLIATGSHLHILDLKGKESKNSPVKVPSGIVGKISVFDYDNKGEYRVLFAGKDNKIHNITLEGAELPDWQKPELSGKLKSLQFFRTAGRDYILYTDSKGRIGITDRKGKPRVKVEDRLLVSSGSAVFENNTNNKGIFLMATSSGDVAYIAGTGDITESRFGEHGRNPWFDYADFNNDGNKDFIFCGNGLITVYSRMKKIIASASRKNANFSKPFIYRSPKECWLVVRDQKNGKILAFNQDNKTFSDASLTSDCDPVIIKRNNEKKPVLVTVKKGKTVFTILK